MDNRYRRLCIYLVTNTLLSNCLKGKARIKNIPEDAEIYRVVLYEPQQCDSVVSVWFYHSSFDEIPDGNLIPSIWAIGEEIVTTE